VAILRYMLMTMLAAFAFTTPLSAQTHIAASLVAESNVPAPGSSTTIALRMQPQPGWHGYWINPGEAGFATRLEWQLPKGVTVSAPRYPVPERLMVAGLMNHVFNGEHALLMSVAVPKLAKGVALPFKLSADWLACTDKICVPEHADLLLNLTVGAGTSSALAQFDGWRAKLPQPLGGTAHFQLDGKRIRIGIPFPVSAALDDPWFFAKTQDIISYPALQKVTRKGDLLIVETETSGPSPAMIEGVLTTAAGRGLEISAAPGTVPSGGEAVSKIVAPKSDLWTILLALGGAILGGLVLNIMPCVFPIISLKALSLARAGGDEAAAKREALAYAAGVILTCVALGGLLLGLRAGGAQVGWAFQLQNPYIIFVLLLLASAITLNLAGLFQLRSFGGGDALAGQGGIAGAFWTGILAAFVATPCTGPFMAAALGAALVLPTIAALAIFAGLGFGLALPFLALGYIPALRSRLPRPGAWMVTFQRILAIPMALTVVALAWLLWREIGPSHPAPANGVSAVTGDLAFNEAKLTNLTKAGKPVFLYFTADWCLTCKVNEKAAIERDEVSAAFKRAGVTVMVGDWTNGDPAITRFINAKGASGVPLYLFYPKGGGAPQQLPQVLTPGTLIALAK
jgi:DsbC/DsbD-like thiol-disulfide interchange protein/cytochrome c biogenesis protein CcdA